jgi:hypothetical protein
MSTQKLNPARQISKKPNSAAAVTTEEEAPTAKQTDIMGFFGQPK